MSSYYYYYSVVYPQQLLTHRILRIDRLACTVVLRFDLMILIGIF